MNILYTITILSTIILLVIIYILSSKSSKSKESYVKPCIMYSNEDICKQINCSWNAGLNLCMGTPKQCKDYDQNNCNDNVGCTWSEIITDQGKSYTCLDS